MQLSEFLPEREDAMHDALWVLRLLGAGAMQVGLTRLLIEMPGSWALIGAGTATFFLASVSHFWLRILLTAAWGVFLLADFCVRLNPFSLIFALPPLWHVILLGLTLRPRPESPV